MLLVFLSTSPLANSISFALLALINISFLVIETYDKGLTLIQMTAWLRLKLEHSRVSINKLKRLFFISNEKRSRSDNNQSTDNANGNMPKENDDNPGDNKTIDETITSSTNEDNSKSTTNPRATVGLALITTLIVKQL